MLNLKKEHFRLEMLACACSPLVSHLILLKYDFIQSYSRDLWSRKGEFASNMKDAVGLLPFSEISF